MLTPKQQRFVDFSHVEPHQAAMHDRLLNWARACRSAPGNSASPMFRLYRPSGHWNDAVPTTVAVDQSDAVRVARGVQALPEPHMHALNWHYLSDGNVSAGRRKLACSAVALAQYVRDARQMLINRGV